MNNPLIVPSSFIRVPMVEKEDKENQNQKQIKINVSRRKWRIELKPMEGTDVTDFATPFIPLPVIEGGNIPDFIWNKLYEHLLINHSIII